MKYYVLSFLVGAVLTFIISSYFNKTEKEAIRQHYEFNLFQSESRYKLMIASYQSQVESLKKNETILSKEIISPSGEKIKTKAIKRSVSSLNKKIEAIDLSEDIGEYSEEYYLGEILEDEKWSNSPSINYYKVGLVSIQPSDVSSLTRDSQIIAGMRVFHTPLWLDVQIPIKSSNYLKDIRLGIEFEF